MEAVKIFVIVLTVLGSAQALLNVNEIWNPVALNPGSASAIAAQALEDALTSINATTERTVAKAEQARVQVQGIVNQLQAALAQVQAAQQQLATSATSSLSLAGALSNPSVAVSSCISGKAGDFRNVTMQTGADIVACFTDKIKEAQDILAAVLTLGSDAVAIGSNAITGIRNCPALSFLQLLPRLMCLAGEVAKASTESVSIIAGLTGNVTKALALAATAQTDIQRCVGVRIVSFVVKTAQVAAEMGFCVVGGL